MDAFPSDHAAITPLDAPSVIDSHSARADASLADALDSAAPDDSTSLPQPVLHELSPEQLEVALANKDMLLIDVHTPNAGSVPGTDARIVYTDTSGLVSFIGPNLDRAVVLTCRGGAMSHQAGNALVGLGYRNISELTGGTTAWTAAGYSLVFLDSGT